MTDEELVERLLDWPYQGETMAQEAADRIKQLTAERDRLRKALTDALYAWDIHQKHGFQMAGWWVHDASMALKGDIR